MNPAQRRRLAEALLRERKKTAPLVLTTAAETRRLLYEVQVHEIELEMQNEELVRAQAEREAALAQFTELYDFAPVGYLTLAPDGTLARVNRAVAALLGRPIEHLAQRRLGLFVDAGSLPVFNAFLERVFASRQTETCEVSLAAPDTAGTAPRWARLEGLRSATGPHQPAVGRVAVLDITAARQAQAALRQSEAHFRNLAQALPDAVYTLSLPAGAALDFNHASYLGYPRASLLADVTGLHAQHPDEAAAFAAYWQQVLAGETPPPCEYRVRNAAGAWEWVKSQAVPLPGDPAGAPARVLVILTTITERKEAAEALRQLSTHDALTGLYNRRYFEEELARLERGRRYPISLVVADVDGLKTINDELGHAAGDALLQQAARALTAAVRAEDVVTRIGGDEFAMLLPETDAAAAEAVLSRVRQLLDESSTAGGRPLSLSLGVCTATSPSSLAAVFTAADAAMYREKRWHHAN